MYTLNSVPQSKVYQPSTVKLTQRVDSGSPGCTWMTVPTNPNCAESRSPASPPQATPRSSSTLVAAADDVPTGLVTTVGDGRLWFESASGREVVHDTSIKTTKSMWEGRMGVRRQLRPAGFRIGAGARREVLGGWRGVLAGEVVQPTRRCQPLNQSAESLGSCWRRGRLWSAVGDLHAPDELHRSPKPAGLRQGTATGESTATAG